MKKKSPVYFILPFLVFILLCANVFSQDRHRGMQIPPRVFVGDRASLILPLQPMFFTGLSSGSVELPREQLPFSEEIDIHRITAEFRQGSGRLVIEFSAYTPGILEIPPFEIAGEIFSGLLVEISSVLENDGLGPVLSGSAATLAIPGTSLLIYGTLGVVLLLLSLIFWLLFKGRKLIESRFALWRRKRLVAAMFGIERRLRKGLAKNTCVGETLKTLSNEFRSFLGFWTGENCRAMTAVELSRINPYSVYPGISDGVPDGRFLGDFFTRCDRLRFGGEEIKDSEALALLDDLRIFLKEADAALRKKVQTEGEAA